MTGDSEDLSVGASVLLHAGSTASRVAAQKRMPAAHHRFHSKLLRRPDVFDHTLARGDAHPTGKGQQ